MTREEVFTTYHERIVHYIERKVSNHFVAEDLASDVMLKVYSKLDEYDENKASISTWIYTIANNRVIDYYRTNHVAEDIADSDYSSDFSVEEDIISKESLGELAEALKKLPERERDIIILHYYDNLNLKEIANRMKISYSYVKIIHHTALHNLKSLLED